MKANRAEINRNPIKRTRRTDLRPLTMFGELVLLGISLFGKVIRISSTVTNERKEEA
jgi:hypothetical protein